MQKLQSCICTGMCSAVSWHNKLLLLYNMINLKFSKCKINTIL